MDILFSCRRNGVGIGDTQAGSGGISREMFKKGVGRNRGNRHEGDTVHNFRNSRIKGVRDVAFDDLVTDITLVIQEAIGSNRDISPVSCHVFEGEEVRGNGVLGQGAVQDDFGVKTLRDGRNFVSLNRVRGR